MPLQNREYIYGKALQRNWQEARDPSRTEGLGQLLMDRMECDQDMCFEFLTRCSQEHEMEVAVLNQHAWPQEVVEPMHRCREQLSLTSLLLGDTLLVSRLRSAATRAKYVASGRKAEKTAEYVASGRKAEKTAEYGASGCKAATRAESVASGRKAATRAEYVASGREAATRAKYVASGRRAAKTAEYVASGRTAATRAEYVASGREAATYAEYVASGRKAAAFAARMQRSVATLSSAPTGSAEKVAAAKHVGKLASKFTSAAALLVARDDLDTLKVAVVTGALPNFAAPDVCLLHINPQLLLRALKDWASQLGVEVLAEGTGICERGELEHAEVGACAAAASALPPPFSSAPLARILAPSRWACCASRGDGGPSCLFALEADHTPTLLFDAVTNRPRMQRFSSSLVVAPLLAIDGAWQHASRVLGSWTDGMGRRKPHGVSINAFGCFVRLREQASAIDGAEVLLEHAFIRDPLQRGRCLKSDMVLTFHGVEMCVFEIDGPHHFEITDYGHGKKQEDRISDARDIPLRDLAVEAAALREGFSLMRLTDSDAGSRAGQAAMEDLARRAWSDDGARVSVFRGAAYDSSTLRRSLRALGDVETLLAVPNQTRRTFEVVVVDLLAGSSPLTAAKLRRLRGALSAQAVLRRLELGAAPSDVEESGAGDGPAAAPPPDAAMGFSRASAKRPAPPPPPDAADMGFSRASAKRPAPPPPPDAAAMGFSRASATSRACPAVTLDVSRMPKQNSREGLGKALLRPGKALFPPGVSAPSAAAAPSGGAVPSSAAPASAYGGMEAAASVEVPSRENNFTAPPPGIGAGLAGNIVSGPIGGQSSAPPGMAISMGGHGGHGGDPYGGFNDGSGGFNDGGGPPGMFGGGGMNYSMSSGNPYRS